MDRSGSTCTGRRASRSWRSIGRPGSLSIRRSSRTSRRSERIWESLGRTTSGFSLLPRVALIVLFGSMKRFKSAGADSILHGPSKKRTDESGVRPVDPASPPGGPNIASPGMEGRFHNLHVSADDSSRRGFGPRGTPRWQRHPPHPHDGRPVVHFHARVIDEVAEYASPAEHAIAEAETAHIYLGGPADARRMRDIPAEKFEANSLGGDRQHEPRRRRRVRDIDLPIGRLTPERAETYGLDYASWSRSYHDALEVDLEKIEREA